MFLKYNAQRGIVSTNFGLKFQKIKIDYHKCLVLLAAICPDKGYKDKYKPSDKHQI